MINNIPINPIQAEKSISMKKAHVLHNPGAGEGGTSREELLNELESNGFKCSYSSTKPFRWENIETEDFDFLVLAGGDGTVRKIAGELLSRKVIDRNFPIGLLPMGTANNIAKTLRLPDSPSDIIAGWHHARVQKFDVGKISGLDKPHFFLESFGYGLFPSLMQEMKKQKKNDIEDPKEQLHAALILLRELIDEAPVKKCKLTLNGKDYSGEFLLIEVMNIRSIGPNLNLAPAADPSDGAFEIVLITESQRTALAEYVQRKIDGEEVLFQFPIIKATDLTVFWDGKRLHIDDKQLKVKEPVEIKIEMRKGLLEFLLPAQP